jgi:hypothetical protein
VCMSLYKRMAVPNGRIWQPWNHKARGGPALRNDLASGSLRVSLGSNGMHAPRKSGASSAGDRVVLDRAFDARSFVLIPRRSHGSL